MFKYRVKNISFKNTLLHKMIDLRNVIIKIQRNSTNLQTNIKDFHKAYYRQIITL